MKAGSGLPGLQERDCSSTGERHGVTCETSADGTLLSPLLRNDHGPKEGGLLEEVVGAELPENIAAARAAPKHELIAVCGGFDEGRRKAGEGTEAARRRDGKRIIDVPDGSLAAGIT